MAEAGYRLDHVGHCHAHGISDVLAALAHRRPEEGASATVLTTNAPFLKGGTQKIVDDAEVVAADDPKPRILLGG